MHFALPPRKTSQPPPYALRSSRGPLLRRSRLQHLLLFAVGAIGFIWLLSRLLSGPGEDAVPAGTPPVVIVTVIDPKHDSSFIEKIKENRIAYAKRHGYTTFFPKNTDYDLGDSTPLSWSKIPALRHAMTLNPHSTWFWYLDSTALIMQPSISLEEHITTKEKLESLMVVNQPVVPPDSVIKTFAHLKGDRIDLVVSQDQHGLCDTGFLVRRGEWAKYFLDAWFDPLYRSYNFQKAEAHALEHIVQWHGTILAKLALIPQRLFNAYAVPKTKDEQGIIAEESRYQEGDFIAAFPGCDKAPERFGEERRSCETEMGPYLKKLAIQSA